MFRFFLKTVFKVFFIVNTFKAAQSFIRSNTAFSMNQIDKYAIRPLRNSLKSKSSFFLKPFLIAELISEIVNAVKELASFPIEAVALLLVLSA
jgi:hypothetical protein